MAGKTPVSAPETSVSGIETAIPATETVVSKAERNRLSAIVTIGGIVWLRKLRNIGFPVAVGSQTGNTKDYTYGPGITVKGVYGTGTTGGTNAVIIEYR
jgi:hypothetical protein